MIKQERRSVGTTGIPGALPFGIGIGYVILPYGVEREPYVKTCLQTNTVSIRSEGGDFFKNVPISNSELGHITFPDEAGKIGSPVIFGVITKHNSPVILTVLKLKNQAGNLTEEGQFKFTANNGDDFLDVDVKTLNGTDANVSLSGQTAKLKITVNGAEEAVFDLVVNGDLTIHSTTTATLSSEEEVYMEIVDGDNGQRKSHIGFDRNAGIWQIFADSASEGQPGVLGDILENKIAKMCDLIGDMAQAISVLTVGVLAPNSPSAVPINATSFVNLKLQVEALKQEISQIKSTKFKID